MRVKKFSGDTMQEAVARLRENLDVTQSFSILPRRSDGFSDGLGKPDMK